MARKPFQRAVLRVPLLALIAAIVVLEFPGARDLIDTPYSGIVTQNLVVQGIHPSGPNAGGPIREGDEIIRVGDTRVRNYNHLRYLVKANEDFAPQEYELLRDGRGRLATVRYSATPASIIYRRFTFLVVGFTFLLVAILVLMRRHDATGILFALNCTIFAFFLTDRPVYGLAGLQLADELFHDMVILLFPAVFMHFFIVFHDRPLRLSRRGRLRRIAAIYALPTVVYLLSSVFAIGRFLGMPRNQNVVGLILTVATAYMAVYLLASLVIFVRNYRTSSDAQRQKLRIAILGTVVGILPFLAMTIWRQFSATQNMTLEFVSAVALSFISISFAYAILKHGAIELNIVVRKSLAYAFLTGVVIAGYYALVNLVGNFLIRELALRPVYFSVITVLVLAVLFAPARDRVQKVVDRVFSRGDYDYREQVVEFNRQLSKKLKKDEILEYAFERVSSLLKSSYVALYEAGNGNSEEGDALWIASKHRGNCPSLPEIFPRTSLLGRYLTRYRKPLMVEYLDYSWGRRNLDTTSSAFLNASQAAVCLPVTSPELFFGLVVLGPKRSGRLYTRTDSNLLERFGEHLGLVLENAQLHEAAIEQERLKNEVLLAREIQLSLLPKVPPQHENIDMLGKMDSSVEIGGDYFDYFVLEPGRIGVAIGDVNGKGVPAAMLMSSIQAVFKNLALRDPTSPAELVSALNRYLCDNAESEQFATFFYGIIDLNDSTFTFSNAGHCPALLLKPDYVDRLGEGGLPLGVESVHRYQEGRVRFAPDDLLCLYTDGITEQHNGVGADFGETGLVDFLQVHRTLPASKLTEMLFARVRAYGDGRQDDDMTTIIAHHKAS